VLKDRIRFAFRNWFTLTSAITLLIILESLFVANIRYQYSNTDNVLSMNL
jgi:hypothetical protein